MIRSLGLPFGLVTAVLLTIAASVLAFPRLIGLSKSASLEEISKGDGLLYEAPWPKTLRRPPKRTILPNDGPALTENAHALIHPGARRRAIEEQGAGRFRITGNKVQFSSSDGTSPVNNGRTYVISTSALRVPEWLLVLLWSAALIAWLPLSFRFGARFLHVLRRVVERLRLGYRTLALKGLLPGSSTPLLERFNQLLLPVPFFAGVVLGLALCIAGGRLAARGNLYSDRSRFFFQISPEGCVYPTLENLLQFVRQKAPPEKILVLSAGSSISLGVGQQNGHLWTNLLQSELGGQFSVVNVSFRAARFTSIGLPLIEILSKEYPRLLFVTESRPGYAPKWMHYRADSSYFYPYNYVLLQAWLSGKLLANPTRDWKLTEALHSPDEFTRLHAREDLIRAILEKATCASDLWNYLSYRHFFTAFSPVQLPEFSFWVPRMMLPDDEWNFAFDSEGLEKSKDRQLSILKAAYVDTVESAQDGGFKLSARAYAKIDLLAEAFPDPGLRERTLFLVTTRNPYLAQRLSLSERQKYQASVLGWTRTLEEVGFHALPLGMNYDTEDFIDAHHLSNKAAPKMAFEIAYRVRKMAEKKGWIY